MESELGPVSTSIMPATGQRETGDLPFRRIDSSAFDGDWTSLLSVRHRCRPGDWTQGFGQDPRKTRPAGSRVDSRGTLKCRESSNSDSPTPLRTRTRSCRPLTAIVRDLSDSSVSASRAPAAFLTCFNSSRSRSAAIKAFCSAAEIPTVATARTRLAISRSSSDRRPAIACLRNRWSCPDVAASSRTIRSQPRAYACAAILACCTAVATLVHRNDGAATMTTAQQSAKQRSWRRAPAARATGARSARVRTGPAKDKGGGGHCRSQMREPEPQERTSPVARRGALLCYATCG